MNVEINHDLMKTINNYNSPYTSLKFIKGVYSNYDSAKLALGLYGISNLILYHPIRAAIRTFIVGVGVPALVSLYYSLKKDDPFKVKDQDNLAETPEKLKALDINTNEDLLIKTKLTKKEYKFRINEDKTKKIVESKFILVPSYDNDNKLVSIPLVQEHELFSKKYVLSKAYYKF
jgi:hypothetical protein